MNRQSYLMVGISFVLLLLNTTLMAKAVFSGRTPGIDSAIWQVNETPLIIEKGAEVFSSVTIAAGNLFGGSFQDDGLLWLVDRNQKITSFVPEGSRAIYTMIKENESTILLGGLHKNLGGGVWRFNLNDMTVSGVTILDDATVIYGLAKMGDRLFAGGVSRGNGKVWACNDNTWDKGQFLYNAVEVTSLTAGNNAVYASGMKKNKSGAYWVFQGDSWKEGQNLKFADSIYASCIDKDGFLYFAGAGQQGKVLWENTKGFWNAISLEDCLALYTIFQSGDGSMYVAGWNKDRRGAFWQTFKDREWKKGPGLQDCFVIRSVTE